MMPNIIFMFVEIFKKKVMFTFNNDVRWIMYWFNKLCWHGLVLQKYMEVIIIEDVKLITGRFLPTIHSAQTGANYMCHWKQLAISWCCNFC